MIILHIISSLDPAHGGTSQAIRSIVPSLLELGVNNEVVCCDNADAPFLGKDEFKVNAVGSAKGPWGYSNNLMQWLLANVKRFDAVVVHGLWQHHGYAASKAVHQINRTPGLSKRVRLYVMPHGMLDPYFQKASGRRLKAIRNILYWRFIESRIINNSDGMLFTCQDELLLARKTFRPYHPKKELVVGLGVHRPPVYVSEMTQAFADRCPQISNQPYFLFLSRINEKKGTDLLINAYIDTFNSSLNGHIAFPKLVVAGPGLDSTYGQYVKKIANESPLADHIFFPGMLVKNSKWGAFYGCEAFVLPSHQENFGIAVVEALACNKAVLISNQINIWREIEAAGGGIVADDTYEGTKTLLQRWTAFSDIQKIKMGDDALEAYNKNFSLGPPAHKMKNAIS
ncbi:MAG: glycosyltransferase [Chryseolinea sp.]